MIAVGDKNRLYKPSPRRRWTLEGKEITPAAVEAKMKICILFVFVALLAATTGN